MTRTDQEPDLFAIDPHRLDEEWIKQPSLYRKWARQLANAREEWERAKAQRDVVTAEIDKAIRFNPEEYGLEKITEPSVEKTILLQKRYQRAHAVVVEAKHKVDLLEANVSALDHRKRALEKLVDLFLSDYFSKPREPKDSGGVMQRSKADQAFKKRSRND